MKITGAENSSMDELLKRTKRGLQVRLIKAVLGIVIVLSTFILAWVWFGWKLALILFLVELGMNMENAIKYKKK